MAKKKPFAAIKYDSEGSPQCIIDLPKDVAKTAAAIKALEAVAEDGVSYDIVQVCVEGASWGVETIEKRVRKA